VLRYLLLSLAYKNIKFPGYMGRPLFLMGMKKVKFAKNVRIFPNCRIEVHGDGEIWIGENVSIGQSLHLISQGKLFIGSGTLISSNVLITNLAHGYEELNIPIIEQNHIIKETIIGENCFIGAGAVIQPGTVLGRHCIVGANSVVKGEFSDNSVIVGIPGRVIRVFDGVLGKWVKV